MIATNKDALDYKDLNNRNVAQNIYIQCRYSYYVDLGSKC